MVKPNFVLCFFHNLSGYDSHFLVTQLGFDTQSISVIPNSEKNLFRLQNILQISFKLDSLILVGLWLLVYKNSSII